MATAPFMWGAGGQAYSPDQIERARKVAEALRAVQPNPKTMFEGIQSAIGQIGGEAQLLRADAQEKAARDAYGAQFAGLGDNPSTSSLETLAGSPWANPGQQAVVSALLSQNLDNSNPDTILKREYTQAQIDALKDKPGQPLINSADGIYDPNTGTWIPPPADAQTAAGPAVVQLNDRGIPDPKGQEAFLATLDPQTAGLVKAIANYQADLSKVTSLRGGERQKMAALVQAYDPTFDMTQYANRQSTRKAYSIGPQGQTITSANTAIGHLANLAKDAEALGNGDFTPFNALGNMAKGATSDPDLAQFKSDKKAVAGEAAKFFKGTGATDLTTTEEWEAIFNENQGSGAIKAVVKNVIGNLMKSRLDEMNSQYGMAMGKPRDFRFITPETAGILRHMGFGDADITSIDPNAAAAAPLSDQSANQSGSPDDRAGWHPVPGFDNVHIRAVGG